MTTPVDPGAPVPRARPPATLARRAYDLLVSPKLAIALLVAVLACCLVGVTVWRGEEAGRRIFATLWFNTLLVVLAISSASAFFSRFWRRRLTMVSVGMITFHLSFLGVLGGVVLNGLLSFHGTLRLTEGQTVGVGDPRAYDDYGWGRLFDPARLRGEITLVRLHVNYKVGDDNKRAAYELEVRDGAARAHQVIYVTEYLDFDGVQYYCLKEGYSVLVVMSDQAGRELSGAHIPLQSIRQADGSFFYATGTSSQAGPYPFPEDQPRLKLEVDFWPGLVERTGKVSFQAAALDATGAAAEPQGRMVQVGEQAEVAGVKLAAREIRYWVGLSVRYDPGLDVILGSLVLGLAGMLLTLVGRIRQGGPGRRPNEAKLEGAAAGPRGESR